MKIRHLIGPSIFFFARVRTRVYRAFFSFTFSGLFLATIFSSFISATNLQQTAAKISNSNLSICLPAIQKLGGSKDLGAVAPLAHAFSTEQRAIVRRFITDALGQLGFAEGRPALLAALKDSDSQVRMSAIAALSVLGDKESQAAIRDRVDTETDSDVKAHLIYHMGQTHNAQDFDKLQDLKGDEDPKVSQMADQQLKKFIKNGTN